MSRKNSARKSEDRKPDVIFAKFGNGAEGHLKLRREMFKFADSYAEESLFLVANGLDGVLGESGDALNELVRMAFTCKSHYRTLPRDAHGEIDQDKLELADVQCAWSEAGMALGLAMGLRMRGWGGAR